MIDNKEREDKYFFQARLDPKECRIFFEYQSEKLSESIFLFIGLKREQQEIADEKEYSHVINNR